MEYYFCNTKIIPEDGKFRFTYKGESYEADTLDEAKDIIERLVSDFYVVNTVDIDNILKKLSPKESELFMHGIRKLYFDKGPNDPYKFKFTFTLYDSYPQWESTNTSPYWQ